MRGKHYGRARENFFSGRLRGGLEGGGEEALHAETGSKPRRGKMLK